MNGRYGIGAALVASLMVGCVGNLGDTGVGRVEGSLGEVVFGGEPEIREAVLHHDHLAIDLRIASPSGAAMIGITIPHEGLEGELVLHPEDAAMIGCSGAEDGEWDFDCAPQDFYVDTYGGKDELGLEFEGRWTEDDCGSLPDEAPEDGQPAGGYVDVDLI